MWNPFSKPIETPEDPNAVPQGEAHIVEDDPLQEFDPPND